MTPTTDEYEKPACRDCRYWAPPFKGAPDGAYGDCRRHPPSVDFVGEDPVTAWPATHADEWCGEFRHEPES